jgi:hypothetical protein
VTDPEVVAAALTARDRGADMADWLSSTVRLGALAVTTAGTTADLTRMQDAIDGLTSHIDQAVSASARAMTLAVDRAVDPDSGQLAAASQRAVDRLANGVQRLVTDQDGALPRSVRAAVGQVTDQALAEIQRAVSAHSDAVRNAVATDRQAVRDAVLAALEEKHAALVSTVGELRAAVEQHRAVSAAVAEISDRTNAKGYSFEDECLEVLSRIAARAGDGGCTDVSGLPAAYNSKGGDVLVELTSLGEPAPKLVVELKNRPRKPLNVAQWRQELAKAMTARSAAVGIGVLPPETMPTPGARLIVLSSRTMLVAWEPGDDDAPLLTSAYLLLRMTAQTLSGRSQLSPGVVDKRLEDLLTTLTPLTELEKAIASGRSALTSIESTTNTVREQVTERIGRLRDELRSPHPSTPAAVPA